LLVEFGRQAAGRIIQGAPIEILLPRIKVGINNDSVQRANIVRVKKHQAIETLDAAGGEVALPIKIGHQLIKVFDLNFGVVLRPLARLFFGHVFCGEPGLERHD